MRSTSSMTPRLANDTAGSRRVHWAVALPDISFVYNSTLPYSLNDGSLWAGRGANGRVIAGGVLEYGRVRLFLLPEYTYSSNAPYPLTGPPFVGPLPATRNPFSSPWHANGQSVDLPIRFGDQALRRVSPGQTTLLVDVRGLSFGAGTENEWWGPGVRNALILSNNAPGFAHAFARTNRPWRSRAGSFEARWLVGWLNESEWFDTDATNDIRSVSGLAVTWTPAADTNVTIGAARSVFGATASRGSAFLDALDVVADVGRPNARPYTDSTLTPGRDQLISFFFRWVFPKDGFETYAEWARAEMPISLRDFLLLPNHTQAYTLGLQWLGDSLKWNGRLRAQAEFTYLEQGPTYRQREMGSWYTSRAVVQGYTNRGQSLGAAIGPGSSSQFIALDWVTPRWQAGAFFNRVRWLEDAHSQQPYPPQPPLTFGWCEHDVSMLPGVRGAWRSRFGDVAAEYSTGWRLNVFFENPGPCPIGQGRDVRTNSFSLRLTPKTF